MTKATSLSRVEFGELKVHLSRPFQLHNGKCSVSYKSRGGASAELNNSWLITNDEGIPTHVILYFEEVLTGGSSSPTTFVQVMAFANGELRGVQAFRSIPVSSAGPTVVFDPARKRLRINARTSDDSPSCCPVSVDWAEYQWNGSQFSLSESGATPIKGIQ